MTLRQNAQYKAGIWVTSSETLASREAGSEPPWTILRRVSNDVSLSAAIGWHIFPGTHNPQGHVSSKFPEIKGIL